MDTVRNEIKQLLNLTPVSNSRKELKARYFTFFFFCNPYFCRDVRITITIRYQHKETNNCKECPSLLPSNPE